MSLWNDFVGAEIRYIDTPTYGRIRIAEAGPKDAPVILFQHGIGGHLEAYSKNLVPLSDQFHCIAFDYVGHALSTRKDMEYTPPGFPAWSYPDARRLMLAGSRLLRSWARKVNAVGALPRATRAAPPGLIATALCDNYFQCACAARCNHTATKPHKLRHVHVPLAIVAGVDRATPRPTDGGADVEAGVVLHRQEVECAAVCATPGGIADASAVRAAFAVVRAVGRAVAGETWSHQKQQTAERERHICRRTSCVGGH